MAATAHPSVFPLFCLRPDLMTSESLEEQGVPVSGSWVTSMPTSIVGTFMLSCEMALDDWSGLSSGCRAGVWLMIQALDCPDDGCSCSPVLALVGPLSYSKVLARASWGTQ